jgi:hypothetical protein
MSEHDPGDLADELDQQADQLERHSADVGQQVEETREDWQRKRRDESIPGAQPPESEEEDSPVGADEEPPPEARREG